MDEKDLYESRNHKVRIIEQTGRERIAKVFLYMSRFDSGCDEACLWLDDDIEPGILLQSEISSLQIID